MSWAGDAHRILVRSGFLMLSYILKEKIIYLLNFISRGFLITGAVEDIQQNRIWLIMQKAPAIIPFWGMIRSEYFVPKKLIIHEAQASTKFFERMIALFSFRNLFVVDLCAGSGSVAVACSRVGRYYLGCDHNLERVGAANKRLYGRHYKMEVVRNG